MAEEKKLPKIDVEEVALFIKIFGDSLKEVGETGDFDMEALLEKAGEHHKDVLKYLIKKDKEKKED